MKIFQSVTYTTDHCDGDLIPPSFWPPHVGKNACKQCAAEIISEIKEDIAKCGIGGLDHVIIECRLNGTWQKQKKFSKTGDRRLKTIQEKLEAGQIDCVRVESPEYVNVCGQLIDSYANVYYINSFGDPSKLDG